MEIPQERNNRVPRDVLKNMVKENDFECTIFTLCQKISNVPVHDAYGCRKLFSGDRHKL